MNTKLLSKIECVLFDEQSREALEGLPLTDERQLIDTSDVQGALNEVLMRQKSCRVLAAVSSESFRDIILAVDHSLTERRIAVLFGGELYGEEAIAELQREESLLHTAEGGKHFLENQLEYTKLFADEKQLLMLQGGTGGEILYTSDGTVWGCLLDRRRYSIEGFKGRLPGQLEGLELTERAKICTKIIDLHKAGQLPDISQLVLFEGGELLSAGEPVCRSPRRLADLLYHVYFSHDPTNQKDKLAMLIGDRLARHDYPAFLFEDFTAVFSRSLYPSCRHASPDETWLRNTAERIILTAN